MTRFTVSEGKSRTAKVWEPVQYDWAGFCRRLEEPVRTRETAAQYAAASKDVQAGLKDVGGFVGGVLSGGRRSSQTVENRQLIALDADYADAHFLDDLPWALPCAAAVYTTHSHTPESPRYRIIIPISRPVVADEYEPIARKIAEDIGLQFFDPTTFQPSRLMYWPSASSDGEFIFRQFDGEPLDADAVLARYNDWHDVNAWPACPGEEQLTVRKDRTQDPTLKGGIIGAFCRTYTIPEAIEKYLQDCYTPTPGFEDRYTYAGGSTSGGLVLYDEGTLALSYHATDPANTGHEVNAFDIVRLHLFGDQDERCKESTPVESRPSYKAMMDLAVKDPAVAKTLAAARTEAAQAAFENLTEPDDDNWMGRLNMEKNGEVADTLKNLHIILQHDPKLKGTIALNEFSSQICIVKPLPWHRRIRRADGDPWKNVDDERIQRYLEGYRSKGFSVQRVMSQVLDVAESRAYHPVRSYLQGLTWDGIPRVDTLLLDRLGAESTPETDAYIRAVTRKMLVGAVARVFDPGCKMQYMLVLTGPQGIGKSTLVADLAHGWFSDSVYGIGTKEAQDSIQGYWIIEMSELAATRKVDVEPLKQFLTQQVDTYRGAYDRRKEEHPRQCIFIGTTNSDAFLRDETGDRRYWPVPVYGSYDRLTAEEIDQVWAEARVLYEAGEPLYLDQELEAVARMMQGRYRMEDPWAALIQAYLDKPIPVDWYERTASERQLWLSGAFSAGSDTRLMQRDVVTAAEIWTECLGGQQKDLRKNMTAIHQAMSGVKGWYRPAGKFRISGGLPVRGYKRVQNVKEPKGKVVNLREKQRSQ